MIGNSPCRGSASAIARDLSLRRTAAPARGPLVSARLGGQAPLASLLSRGCRDTSGRDCASDSPDEAGELAGDRDDGDGLSLAFPDQRTIAPVQPALRLPG